jgi:hypothetical protein
MASPGKGIQHRKTPNKILFTNIEKKCWEILQSVAHVIFFNDKLYYSYDIV